ncbi:MAG: zinc ribbon domain-containing protein [Verrucomicrobia bacterium]|nr:zinc ribbon domain-containing protein [Acidobacteriota bacterium]MBM3888285.1 zinc ribbon domain-containing protein [Verrucomicrobiota bacterium]
MPSYDYVCKACHKKFSVHLSISDHDKGKAKCPRCGSKRLEQRLTAFTAVTSKKS